MNKSPVNRPSAFTVDADSKKAVVKLELLNSLVPMLVTPDGMVMDVKATATANVFAVILVNLDPASNIMDVKLVADANA